MRIGRFTIIQQYGQGMAYIAWTGNDRDEAFRRLANVKDGRYQKQGKKLGAKPHAYLLEQVDHNDPFNALSLAQPDDNKSL